MASADGLSRVPYTGADKNELTVGGELDKLASNIAIGRDHAGVHWRSDYTESLKLGEAIAITFLEYSGFVYNEELKGFSHTKFDGKTIIVGEKRTPSSWPKQSLDTQLHGAWADFMADGAKHKVVKTAILGSPKCRHRVPGPPALRSC
jgi:hypothetical protein